MPDFVLLDTDTSSEMIRGRDANIVQKAGDYLKAQGQFRISIITRYEILRSLKAKQEWPQQLSMSVFFNIPVDGLP